MMRLWIVQVDELTETGITVYLSDNSTVEVTLGDLLWLRSQRAIEAYAEVNSTKWD